MRVYPVKFPVVSWALYYIPHRYVGRSPRWRRNYSGPFLVVKIHSVVTVSIQKSQRSDVLVVHTDKLKSFLGTTSTSWLNDTDTGSDTREMGPSRNLGLLYVLKPLHDHPAKCGRAPLEELTATCRPLQAWLITVR